MQNAFYQFEHDFWNSSTAHYDSGFGHVTSQSIEYLGDAIKPKAGSKILDVACGPGYITKAWEDSEVVGVDFSSAMIEIARELNPGCPFEVADAENLPFEDESFDGVCCNFGILHFADPEKAMAEAYRVCKPGGRYAFSVWNALEASPAMGTIMEAVKKNATAEVDLPEGPPFFQYAEREHAVNTLSGLGFSEIEFQVVTATWRIDSAEEFVEYFRNGGARIGGILRAQSEEALRNIIEDIDQNIDQYRTDGGCLVPVSMVIVSGKR